MAARVHVRVQSPDQTPSEEHTETIAVNCHGAMVLLNVPVEVGQKLTVSRQATEEQLSGSVVYIGGKQAGKTQVGIQFDRPSAGFWRIPFP